MWEKKQEKERESHAWSSAEPSSCDATPMWRVDNYQHPFLLCADEMRVGGKLNASHCLIITVSSLTFIKSIFTIIWIYIKCEKAHGKQSGEC